MLGTDSHSQTGVMKAYWTAADYWEMERKGLTFTALDQQIIRNRLNLIQGVMPP